MCDLSSKMVEVNLLVDNKVGW